MLNTVNDSSLRAMLVSRHHLIYYNQRAVMSERKVSPLHSQLDIFFNGKAHLVIVKQVINILAKLHHFKKHDW